MSENVEEMVLIANAGQGDVDAFNDLVLKHQGLLYHHVLALLGDPREAEDVTQEAFIRAFQSIRQFRGGSFRAWLLKIGTNACFDVMRRFRRHPTQALFPEAEDGDEHESPSWMADPGPSVEARVERNMLISRVHRALEQLPVPYRSVITLVDLHELDYEEAAEILQIPLGTVKSQLARARLRMRHMLLPAADFEYGTGPAPAAASD
jgi:RNA polymerase sigma-70 factor (ECF subfamily)